jgi:Cu+-exporting ATPase
MALELNPAFLDSESSHPDNSELVDLSRRFWIAAVLTLPVFVLAMSHLIPGLSGHSWTDGSASQWLQLILTTPVVAWAGWPFFRRAWRSLITRHLNMFTLIAIGVGIAYASSVIAVLWPNAFPHGSHVGHAPIYFESAAMIIVLVLLGQVLELIARGRTGSAIRELMNLVPPTARRIGLVGDEVVPVKDLKRGDRVRIVPGDKIPVDGKVLEGTSTVDESMLTGESIPVDKAAGDNATAGTMNLSGSFVMQADRLGRDTMVGQIVRLVAEAQQSRAPIQNLADQVAGLFVPAVLAISVLTLIAWIWLGPEPKLAHAIVNSIAVLIIACPCALGLATPMAVMVGVGRGAREGILIKNAEAIERLEKVDTLVLDKTGTLTVGRPTVTEIIPRPGSVENELLQLAASLEQHSEHPLGVAIVNLARDRRLKLESVAEFQSVAGGGISGTITGRRLLVGKLELLRSAGIMDLEQLETQAALRQESGQTVVFIAVDNRAAGLIAIADSIKPSAMDAIRDLQSLGLKLSMVTGDNHRTATAIARELGLTSVEAEVEPIGKATFVQSLRSSGHRVAMVGDGINDAPALAAADVGIAMGTGTDVAIQSAGITLVRGDLRGLAQAIRLSRATMHNIRQNLFFAFIYNALGIPIAAGVLFPFFGILLSPIIAGAAMSLSSVSVISNALRLRSIRL